MSDATSPSDAIRVETHSDEQGQLIPLDHGAADADANAQAGTDPAAGDHGSTVDGAAAVHHGGEGHDASYIMPDFPPNFVTLVEAATGGAKPHDAHGEHAGRPHLGHGWWVNPMFSIFFAVVIIVVVRRCLREIHVERPGKLQNAAEAVLGGLRDFFRGIMGHDADKYVPFLGSMWLFILVNNLGALIPGFKSPTYSPKLTFALAAVTFFYVHYQAIRAAGPKHWFMHLVGEPLWMAPLMLPLHIIGELIKPVSLALRLYGNIFGEDKLLASFLGMGMMLIAALFGTSTPIIGVPLHLPFYFLVLLLSTIQATVFTLLAAIYIVLLLPHEEHEHEETHHKEVHEPDPDSPAEIATPEPPREGAPAHG